MKLFLTLILASCSLVAFAQTSDENALFPELSRFSGSSSKQEEDPDLKTEKQDVSDSQSAEEKSDGEDLFAKKETVLESADKTEPEEEKEEEEGEDDEHFIFISFADVKATLTPNRNASFCFASFIALNHLKKELKSFSGDFTIGSMTKQFKFYNVEKERIAGAKYTFVGTSCEEILNPPSYNITTCQVDGWSEKKCKSKVRFVPVPKDSSVE